MPRRFTKIKFDGVMVELHYEEGNGYTDKYTMKCNELPRPECVEKLEALIEAANYYVDGQRAQGNLFDHTAA